LGLTEARFLRHERIKTGAIAMANFIEPPAFLEIAGRVTGLQVQPKNFSFQIADELHWRNGE